MVERIKEIIKAKANGKKAEFARQMNWQPQYVTKLMNGVIGISPIQAILAQYPDINARWLILGEGQMYNDTPSRLMQLIEASRYIGYMNDEEKQQIIKGELSQSDLEKIKQSKATELRELLEAACNRL